jgi:hypothetical protein
VKSSDKSNGSVVFKTAMSLNNMLNPVKFDIKLTKISEKKVTEEIICRTLGGALTYKRDISKRFEEYRENFDSITKTPVDELINKDFVTTKIVKGYLEIYENNRKWSLTESSGRTRFYDYDDILSFELLEGGETITSGGLGRVVIGGLTFGAAGAIVGGITGGKKSKSVCESLVIKISINNLQNPTAYIKFINTATKKSSYIYKLKENLAQECISIFELICKDVQRKSSESLVSQVVPLSEADEILKFKNLLDLGIITQVDFEAKKKQLLGI